TVLLESSSAPVRRAAAEALVVCGSTASAPNLVAALSKAFDDFEEHACGVALLAVAQEPFVRGLLNHPEPRVRRTALFLLDQPPFTTLQFIDLVAPLGSENLSLRGAARSLLERHLEWANAALPWFKEQLANGKESVALENLLISFQSNRAIRNLISE